MVTRTESWWRRSRWALVALVVLVPAAVASALSIDAIDYVNAQPREVTVVAAGDTAELGGAELRVLDSWTAVADSERGREFAVPEGTALVVVTLELDATSASEDFGCQLALLQPDSDRRWSSSYGDTDYWPGSGLPDDLPDDLPSGCTKADAAFPFELTFLVPEDAAGEVVLEAVIPRELPRALHLRLA